MKIPPLYSLWPHEEKFGYAGRDIYVVGIQAYAKAESEGNPWEFANEHICSALAAAIRLPAAHGVFVERNKEAHYASFKSFMSGMELPQCLPPFAKEIVRVHGELACGVVVFDLWIHNKDRNKSNLGYDRERESVHIYDHGDGFIRDANVSNYFAKNLDSVDMSNHCLAPFITAKALDLRDKWIQRIKAIPEPFIKAVLSEAKAFGLTDKDVNAGVKFLTHRQSRLEQLIVGNSTAFPLAKLLFKEESGHAS